MTVTFKYENGDKLGAQFKTRVQKFSKDIQQAQLAAARRAASEIETRGRENIRAGGNFGSARWQEGFQAKLSFASGGAINIRVTHAVPYWKVFEEGRTIRGKPMLWIPLSFATAGSLNVRAREYPKPLFRVERPGKAPLLLDDTGPQYFGKTFVRIPKKWSLRAIVRQVAGQMQQFYREARRSGK
jgi:hypothetical protein